jgi:hypothetical protein
MWILIVGVAVAKDLDPAELSNTASTLDQGEVGLHIWAPSQFGVHDRVQLDTNIPFLAFGPQLTVEGAVYDTEDMQVAIEPMVWADWGFNDLLVGGSAVVSRMLSDKVRFNGSLGVTYADLSIPEESESEPPPTNVDVEVGTAPEEGPTQTYGGTIGQFLVQFAAGVKDGVGLPLTLGVDIVSSETTTWQIVGRAGLLTFGDDTPVFSGGARWVHAGNRSGRVALGIEAAQQPIPRLPADIEEATDGGGSIPEAFFPYPYIDLWWRI